MLFVLQKDTATDKDCYGNNKQTITTFKISEMMETEQSKILMKLEGDEKSIYYYDRPAKDYGIAIGT